MFRSLISRISIYSKNINPYIIRNTVCGGMRSSSFYVPARSFLVQTLLTSCIPEKREIVSPDTFPFVFPSAAAFPLAVNAGENFLCRHDEIRPTKERRTSSCRVSELSELCYIKANHGLPAEDLSPAETSAPARSPWCPRKLGLRTGL